MLLSCSFCYSDVINGTTSNVTGGGLTWSMTNVFPASTGLTVDGVIYRYTAVKNTADPFTVSVQNKNAVGSGLTFQSTDVWTGLPGNSITKVIPVNNIEGSKWGEGSFATEGFGSVKDPFVAYKYRYDTCVADPLSSPACPGYADAWAKRITIESAKPIDPLSNEYVRNALDSKTTIEDERKTMPLSENTKKTDKPLDKKAASNAIVGIDGLRTISQLEMLNNIPGLNLYSINMPGGVYKDVVAYPDKRMPDSRKGRSIGLAQEKLHNAMVESQYNK